MYVIIIIVILIILLLICRKWIKQIVMGNFESKKNRGSSDIVRVTYGPSVMTEEDILNSRVKKLNDDITKLEDRKSQINNDITSLEQRKVALDKEVKETKAQKDDLTKSISELEDKLYATAAKLNDHHVSNEVMTDTNAALSPQILKLISMAYSTLSDLNASDAHHSILEKFISVLHNMGYELLPYSESNKDLYIVNVTGEKCTLRTAIRKISTSELVISGEINI